MASPGPLEDPEQAVDQRALSPETFSRLSCFITRQLGIKMPDSKTSMIQSRLLRRVNELRLGSIDEYASYLFDSGNQAELQHFVNAITTNKTDFFREPRHFAFLRKVLQSAPDSRFGVWSAGCSTGEEPYTLAMVLAEHERLNRGFSFAILATDVSTRVLTAAKSGIYTRSQVSPVPPELRKRYLLQSRNATLELARVRPELRSRVSFHQLNFMDEHYGVKGMLDAIFFRNVMIYYDRKTQGAVINKLCRNLTPGGYLFVGHSESLVGLQVPLQAVQTSIFRKP
jgi:chemotaxis protein methyltransferase CheR